VKRLVALASIALLGLAVLLPSGASAAKKKPVPSLLTYKAMIHVAGGVTLISHKDTFKNCLPGQRWMMEESGDVDIRGNILVETYRNKLVRSTSAITPGGAGNKGALAKYEESNYCPPDEPAELTQPECESHTGKGVAGLIADARRKGPKRVSIGLSRRGGGAQDLSCRWGLGSQPTPFGAEISPLDSIFASIVLPLDIKIGQLRTLGVKKKLIRTIRVGGPCSRPVVYRGKKIPTDTTNMDDGDCVTDGDFVITIKRLNRISKRGIPVS
jgi:hypothetical protein